MRHTAAISLALAMSVCTLGLIILASPSARAAMEDVDPSCKKAGKQVQAAELPQSFDLSECPVEEKIIKDGELGVEVPPEGQGVAVHVTTLEGAQELAVDHREDGTVEILKAGEEKEPASSAFEEELFEAQGKPKACRDRTYNLYGWKAKSRFDWRFNRSTAPRKVNRKAAQRELVRAARAIPRSKNDCGMRDHVDAKQSFEGKTRRRAQIDKNAHCKSGLDSYNVVSFGALPSNYLALACTYYYFDSGYDRLKSSDIKINKKKPWFARRKGCKGKKVDLRSVATHEFGHSFGLDHVSEADHGNLTMSSAPSNGYCDTSARTFGRGDVRGLRALY